MRPDEAGGAAVLTASAGVFGFHEFILCLLLARLRTACPTRGPPTPSRPIYQSSCCQNLQAYYDHLDQIQRPFPRERSAYSWFVLMCAICLYSLALGTAMAFVVLGAFCAIALQCE